MTPIPLTTPIVQRPGATLRRAIELLSDEARSVSIVRIGDSQTYGLKLPGCDSGSIDPDVCPSEVNLLRRWLVRNYNPGPLVQSSPKEGHSRRLGLIPTTDNRIRMVAKATRKAVAKAVTASPSALTGDYLPVPRSAHVLFDFTGDEVRILHAKFAGIWSFKVYVDDVLHGTYSYGGGTSWKGETVITTAPGAHRLRLETDEEAVFRLIAFRPYRKVSVRNEGNPGKSTYHWSPSGEIYQSAVQPQDNVAVVDLGTNNRMATENMSYFLFKDQYRAIIAALQSAGMIVILMTPFRAGFDYPEDATRAAGVGDVAVAVRELADELNLSVIDNYAASCMVEGTDLWHAEEDRLHHNEIGHELKFRNAALALSTFVPA